MKENTLFYSTVLHINNAMAKEENIHVNKDQRVVEKKANKKYIGEHWQEKSAGGVYGEREAERERESKKWRRTRKNRR